MTIQKRQNQGDSKKISCKKIRFINGDKCTVWWGMLTAGEVMHMWGQRVYGNSLSFNQTVLWT